MRDHGSLYLRVATELGSDTQKLTVVTSEPLDQKLLQQVTGDLGEITLYAQGFEFKPERLPPAASAKTPPASADEVERKK